MTVSRSRIDEALRTLPKPGGGGYHTKVLGVANTLVSSGTDPAEAIKAIRQNTPQGTRRVSDREIEQAVEKAYREKRLGVGAQAFAGRRRPPPPSFDAADFMSRLQEQAVGWKAANIAAASPVQVDGKPREQAIRLLEALYAPDDMLYCGDQYYEKKMPGATEGPVRRAADWIAAWRKGAPLPPHIIPNPLTGEWGKTKDGQPSLRADACVRAFRYAVVEFDQLSFDEQVRFWAAVDLPVCALIDSGGKSIHGWVRVDGVTDAAEWSDLVEEKLFNLLVPLGCDRACRNEARLSRLPGHYRVERKRWQRLLYLAPHGRRVRDLTAAESLKRQIEIARRRAQRQGEAAERAV